MNRNSGFGFGVGKEVEDGLAQLMRMRDAEKANKEANEATDKVRAAAEARAIMLHIVNEKIRRTEFKRALQWDDLERYRRKTFFRRKRDHPSCSIMRAAARPICDIRFMRPGEFFCDPKTKGTYMATGTVFVCVERGKPHRCTPTQCAAGIENIDEPGTQTCPISGRDLGTIISDSGMFHHSAVDERAQEDREHAHEMEMATRAPENKPVKSGPSAAARAISRKRQAIENLAAALAANDRSRFQIDHLQKLVLDNSHAHRADVEALVDKIVVRPDIYNTLRQYCARMEAETREAFVAACAERRQFSGPPIDMMMCSSLVASHMMPGLASILSVLERDLTKIARPFEIDYLRRCMFALFYNVRRVASAADVSAYMSSAAGSGSGQSAAEDDEQRGDLYHHHHQDANMKKISLVLFYTLRDGMMGTRIIDSNGLVRTILSPVVAQTESESAKPRPADSDSDDAEDDEDPCITQTYIFVPPHPGLRQYLPDLGVLGKLDVPSLSGTDSLMRKNRQLENYFTRMLLMPNPAELCMDAMIDPIRPDLFLRVKE